VHVDGGVGADLYQIQVVQPEHRAWGWSADGGGATGWGDERDVSRAVRASGA